MGTCSPESKFYPGLHPKQCGSRTREVFLSLCPGETHPEVLHPALGSSAQKCHGTVGVGPDESHKDDWRDGTFILWEMVETVKAVKSRTEVSKILLRTFQY